jgi:hypothetical protein
MFRYTYVPSSGVVLKIKRQLLNIRGWFIFSAIPDEGTYVYRNMSDLWVNTFYEHFIKSVHVLVSCYTILVTTRSVWIK